jgi:hypothetical protein
MSKEIKANETKQNESTMKAVKRAKAVVMYDKNNNAKIIDVTNESETEYKLANKKNVAKADAVANISKNRYNSYTREDNTTYKSYHSHVESFKDVHELFLLVKTIFDDAIESQYFVHCKEKSIKLRIQKDAVEIMSKALSKRANAERCANSKDAVKFEFCVTAKNADDVAKILNTLK